MHVDSFAQPKKPVLQIPYAAGKTEAPIRLSLVVDQMADAHLPSYDHTLRLTRSSVVLLDCAVPALWLDVTDRYLTAMLRASSTLLSLLTLYQHPYPAAQPALAVSSAITAPTFYHISYCRVHPVYMTLSIEATVLVSVSFQRTPFRLRVRPLLLCTGRVDDYIRHVVNGVIPSVLLQSPAFLGALDLIGNPANLLISVYNSVADILRTPIRAGRCYRAGEA